MSDEQPVKRIRIPSSELRKAAGRIPGSSNEVRTPLPDVPRTADGAPDLNAIAAAARARKEAGAGELQAFERPDGSNPTVEVRGNQELVTRPGNRDGLTNEPTVDLTEGSSPPFGLSDEALATIDERLAEALQLNTEAKLQITDAAAKLGDIAPARQGRSEHLLLPAEDQGPKEPGHGIG